MNKKGNIFLGVIIGMFIFISGVLIVPFLADDISTLRTNLNCANPSQITGGVMVTCLLNSALIPYFIWFFTSIALGFIIGGKI